MVYTPHEFFAKFGKEFVPATEVPTPKKQDEVVPTIGFVRDVIVDPGKLYRTRNALAQ